jgi:hypothetical protein
MQQSEGRSPDATMVSFGPFRSILSGKASSARRSSSFKAAVADSLFTSAASAAFFSMQLVLK